MRKKEVITLHGDPPVSTLARESVGGVGFEVGSLEVRVCLSRVSRLSPVSFYRYCTGNIARQVPNHATPSRINSIYAEGASTCESLVFRGAVGRGTAATNALFRRSFAIGTTCRCEGREEEEEEACARRVFAN